MPSLWWYNQNRIIQIALATARKPYENRPEGEPRKYFREIRLAWLNEIDYENRIRAMATINITPDGEIEIEEMAGDVKAETVMKHARQFAGKATKKEEQDIISLWEFLARIPDEEAAIAFIEEEMWEGIPRCGRCNGMNVYEVKNRSPLSHRCRDCNRHFSVLIGTTMEGTNLPLRKWLMAIYMLLTDRKGESALMMHKFLGVTYQTAWFLDHRIREAMRQDNGLQLMGIIQVDEAHVGGKGKNIHKSKKPEGWTWKSNKHSVVALRDESGQVIIVPVPDTYGETLQKLIQDNVEPGSTVWTDEAPGYKAIKDLGYVHEWVTHSTGEYVRDMVTTNGVESVWALLKRGYTGTYHYMSWRHFRRYCDEFAFRNNIGPGNGFDTIGHVLRRMKDRHITYQQLIEKELE